MSQKIFTRPLIAAALILTGCFNSLGIEQAKVPLSKLRLPPGFQISIFSDEVPGVRSLALSEDGVVFAGTRGEKVYSIEDKDRDGTADSVKTLVDGMNMPNGIAFHGGALYVAEVNQVWRFEKGKKVDFSDSRRKLIRGDLPKDVHHGWKYIRFGPDGMLYIPVGAPCNVCLKKDPRYASLLKMKPDGTDLAVYASGIRNTVGFDWDPRTGNLWFTDNGRDWMGDDLPSDELNVTSKGGVHFGFPFCHQGDFPDPEFNSRPCSEFEPPARKLGAHVASLGIRFYQGAMFPSKYRKGAFIAEHGSWNRSSKVGYRVVFVQIEGKKVIEEEVFVGGWLQAQSVSGRPVDILELPDGSILISDDHGGKIYRVSYEEKSKNSPSSQ